MQALRSFLCKQTGTTAIEYSLLIALISVGVISIAMTLQPTLLPSIG